MPKATTGTEEADTLGNLHLKALLTFTCVFETAVCCWDECDFITLPYIDSAFCAYLSVQLWIWDTFWLYYYILYQLITRIVSKKNLLAGTHSSSIRQIYCQLNLIPINNPLHHTENNPKCDHAQQSIRPQMHSHTPTHTHTPRMHTAKLMQDSVISKESLTLSLEFFTDIAKGGQDYLYASFYVIIYHTLHTFFGDSLHKLSIMCCSALGGIRVGSLYFPWCMAIKVWHLSDSPVYYTWTNFVTSPDQGKSLLSSFRSNALVQTPAPPNVVLDRWLSMLTPLSCF